MADQHLDNIELYARSILTEVEAIRQGTEPPASPTNEIKVTTTSELQQAVDNNTDVTIKVKPGNYDILVLRNGRKNIKLEADTELGAGRAESDWSEALVKLKSFKVENKAESYSLKGFHFLPSSASAPIIALGTDSETVPENTPNDIVFDQCLCNANPDVGGKRGIMICCRNFKWLNGTLSGFWYSSDSQAICGWNGPGPFEIDNSYLEASGENFMLGGADSMAVAMQPQNLKFTNNHVYKPLAWKQNTGATVKNLFELKHCNTAIIENNLFENNWKDGQVGYAIVFTPRNQNGRAPYTVVKNVSFRWNVVRNTGAGFSILGDDNLQPSQKTENIIIENNLLCDVDTVAHPGSSGVLFLITRAPKNVLISRNTCTGGKLNSFMAIEQSPEQLNVLNNIFKEGSYGLKTTAGLGIDAFNKQTIESQFKANCIIPSGARNIDYGAGNTKVANPFSEGYVSNVDAGVDMVELQKRVKF
jgi:hypothetical protein